MALFIFAALAVTAVAAVVWGTVALASHQPRQELPTMTEAAPDSAWMVTETDAAPGWAITPAHLRMW
jgi:hypothetical protein